MQRFEFTYEQGYKTLRRYLEYTAPNPGLIRSDDIPGPDPHGERTGDCCLDRGPIGAAIEGCGA